MHERSGSDLDVTVVLPVFNEKGHLREEIDRIRESLDASEYTYEIVVVDDGSTDGSGAQLREIEGIRLIQFAQNRGSGSARKFGTHMARGEIVVWTDADMSYPNDEIPRLIKEMEGFDQVVGARTSEQGTKKMLRVPAKWFIRKLATFLTGVKIPDLNSGLRAFRKDVASQFLHLLPPGFSCVTTLTMTFLSNGYSVKYVPIDYQPRAGESKFHWWTDTRKYLLQVVRMVLLYNPLKILMPIALFILAGAAGKLVFDVITKDFRVGTNTLLGFVTGSIVLLVALLSDLLVQLNRPRDAVDPAAVFTSEGR